MTIGSRAAYAAKVIRPLAPLILAMVCLAAPSLAAAQEECGAWSVLVDAPQRYEAGVWAGVPRGQSYEGQHDRDRGLVRMVGSSARRESFVIDTGIRQVVRARGACASADAIDIVITESAIFVVRVYGVDEGVFGLADVYRLGRSQQRMRSRLRALGGRALEDAVAAILAPPTE